MKNPVTYFLILLYCLGGAGEVKAQSHFSENRDTLSRLNRNEGHLLGSTGKDSMIFLQRKFRTVEEEPLYSTNHFYDSLRNRFSRNRFTLGLYDLIFTQAVSGKENTEGDPEVYFHSFRNHVIRKIILQKLEVFGPTIWDTTTVASSWVEKTLNKAHFSTRDRIIRKNLLFGEGDKLEPYIVSDNERLLRRLPFIKDARILVRNAPGDSIDLIILTKDVLSLGFNLAIEDINKSNYEIYNRNIFGIGHELAWNILWDGDQTRKLGFSAMYDVNNFGGSFVRGSVKYTNAFNRKSTELLLARRFYALNTKYAGGLNIRFTSTLVKPDTATRYYPYRYNYQDYWIGRSFIINPSARSRIVVAARYIKHNVFERPYITRMSHYSYHNRYMTLASVSFSRERYLASNLIYQYGRTEDIPYGTLVEFTGGLEIDEFYRRPYTGVRVAGGRYFSKLGFLATSCAAGGFIRDGGFEQASFQVRSNYHSYLFDVGRFTLRQFVDLDYTVGIRRFADEHITLSDEMGIRGLISDSLSGTRRLAVNIETVAFAPRYIYGFRFAFYWFADIGLVGERNSLIPGDRFFSGFGLGVRIRNENLVFKTFEIRFGIYPTIPPGALWYPVHISSGKRFEPVYFDPREPSLVGFR